MNEFLFNLILALIPAVALILTFVVTKIAGKYGKNLDYAEAMYWTKIAVAIIEDKYGEDAGKLKKKEQEHYVMAVLIRGGVLGQSSKG